MRRGAAGGALVFSVLVLGGCTEEPTVHGALTGNTTLDLGPAIEVPLVVTCGEVVVRDASDLRGDFSLTVSVPESTASSGAVQCSVAASMLGLEGSSTVSMAVTATDQPAPVTEVGAIALDPRR